MMTIRLDAVFLNGALATLVSMSHGAPRAATPASCDGLRIITMPNSPRQGALFRIRVDGAAPTMSLHGTAAGEPLHFIPVQGAHEALAAAPIDAESPLRVTVVCSSAGQTDSVVKRVTIARASYPIEQLRVAPQFSAPPDSVLDARMRREAALAADVARRAHETPQLWTAPFRRPREARVTSTFGRGREFNGTVTSRHMGTDYAGAVGAIVRAPNRGVVRLVESFFLGGNVVYLDHGAGLVTAYLHLSSQQVTVGDTVKAGDVIGKVGATGRVTGPHLHWIVRYGGVTVDPASLLGITGAWARP